MSLTVLTDEQIAGLLDDLTLEEAEAFRDRLRAALHEYSTGTQSADQEDVQQPPRTAISSTTTGLTTVFTPSWSTRGVGMKVLTTTALSKTVATPSSASTRSTGAMTLFSPAGRPLGMLHAGTLTAFRTALASTCLLQRRQTVRDILVFGSGEQAYWHVRLALLFRGHTIRRVNIICRRLSPTSEALMRRFYTAPAARKKREGWSETQFSILTPAYNEYPRLLTNHLRSADVVFCCTPSIKPLFDASILTSHEGRRKGRLIVAIGSFTRSMHELPADILLQATGGPGVSSPGAGALASGSSGVVGIGLDAAVLQHQQHQHHHHHAARHHYHKHAVEGGVIVVDTLDGVMRDAGEIVDAGLTPRQLVELGELVMLRQIHLRDEEEASSEETDVSVASPLSSTTQLSSDLERLEVATQASSLDSDRVDKADKEKGGDVDKTEKGEKKEKEVGEKTEKTEKSVKNGKSLAAHIRPLLHRRTSSQASVEQRKKKDDHLARWLQTGNVIYKSVGLGVMDLCVGMHLIEFARQKGVGTHIAGF